MLAGPSSTLATMALAVATTIDALDAAAELDRDRSDEDRAFFAARKAILAPLKPRLVAARRAIEDHDLDSGARLQVRVEMGDQVLDRGVSEGNTRTKLGLRGKPGLASSHVFGPNVATLTKEKIAIEPRKVLDAVERFDEVADFPERAAVAADLTSRANQQQGCVDDREAGYGARAKLVSAGMKLVLDGADALAATKGALDERFPRQRSYVATFFFDVAPARAKAGEVTSEEPTSPVG